MTINKFLRFLVFALVLTLVIGCSSDKDNEASGTNDEDGKPTISISMRTQALPYVENHTDINEDKYVKKLEELTNVNLDFRVLPHTDFDEKMTVMLASDNIPDVVMATGIFAPELAGGVEAGAFMPLNDLLEEHGQNLLEVIPQEAWDEVTWDEDGQIYAIPSYLTNNARRGTAIRMDLLEKAGLDVPETTEEFFEVLKAFKELGVEHPFKGRSNFRYADNFLGAFDALPFQWELHEDQVVPKFMIDDRMKQALEFHHRMYEEGLLHQEFLTLDDGHRSVIVSGDAGMWSMNAMQVYEWESELKEHVPDAEVAIIPSPKGPDNKGGHHYYGNTVRTYLIHNDTKADPVDIIKFFDWMVSEEASEFFNYGIEGENYTKDSNGNINYEMEETPEFLQEQEFRTGWLWMVRDETYTEGILELTEEGQELMDVFDNVLSNEGRGSITFVGGIEALNNNPDIMPGPDSPPPFWMTEAAKIIVGDEPIEYYDEIVEKWLELGGQAAIDEATERYKNEDGVIILE